MSKDRELLASLIRLSQSYAVPSSRRTPCLLLSFFRPALLSVPQLHSLLRMTLILPVTRVLEKLCTSAMEPRGQRRVKPRTTTEKMKPHSMTASTSPQLKSWPNLAVLNLHGNGAQLTKTTWEAREAWRKVIAVLLKHTPSAGGRTPAAARL